MSMEEKENYMMSVLGEFEYYANIEEAREAAREEGLEQSRREVAKNMKAEGFALDIIARCTGLELEAVEAL